MKFLLALVCVMSLFVVSAEARIFNRVDKHVEIEKHKNIKPLCPLVLPQRSVEKYYKFDKNSPRTWRYESEFYFYYSR